MKSHHSTNLLPDYYLPRLMDMAVTIIFLAGFSTGVLYGQTEQQRPESLFDFLSKKGQFIELTLRTDMDELINHRRREDYQPAELFYSEEKKQERKWDIGVVPRGNYRRHVCIFPPIRFNFSRNQLEEQGLSPDFDKIKVVAHCQEGEEGDNYILKEFLVYKIYNQLTPNSYRVQLARITYLDTEGNYKKFKHFAILIEETDEMAHRLGGAEFEEYNPPPEAFNTEAENLMAVFQYMIGNEDWDYPMIRNMKLIQPSDSSGLIPIPYDFDFSGLVNAPYAIPSAQYGHSTLQERIFLGYPVRKEQLRKTLEHFHLYRSNIRAVIKGFKLLRFSERMRAIDYIESFFASEGSLIRENAVKFKEQKPGEDY
ncbi:MAG: hypothetical protein H6556_26475 [Lewinellaceae bacterium]|nr:hypothetical protein [Lewinellaceae bacterium]